QPNSSTQSRNVTGFTQWPWPHSPTEWEQWHRVTRTAITKQHVTAHADKATPDDTRLIHSHCQRRTTGAQKDPALLYA
ncbi:hypothetical protein, partial [Micromonospora sp. LOL_024]|uniref:hypothetical protein n=1 Tax=Micromonospora sp. LOL_024 TaxID=3345412 RepID=UPI003A840F4B